MIRMKKVMALFLAVLSFLGTVNQTITIAFADELSLPAVPRIKTGDLPQVEDVQPLNDRIERLKERNYIDPTDEKLSPDTLQVKMEKAFKKWVVEDSLTDENRAFVMRLLQNASFTQFDNSDREKIENILGVDFSDLIEMENQGASLESIFDILLLRAQFNFEMKDILENLSVFLNKELINEILLNYIVRIPGANSGSELDIIFKSYMVKGAEPENILLAYAAAQEYGIKMDNLIDYPEDMLLDNYTPKIETYARMRRMSADTFADKLWESDTVETLYKQASAYAAESGLQDPGEMQYGAAPFSYHYDDTESVNMNTGAFTYRATDLHLQGANGLDLVITRRYNSSKSNEYNPRPQFVDAPDGVRVYSAISAPNSNAINAYGLGYGWELELPYIEQIEGNYTLDRKDVYNAKKYDHLNLGNGQVYEIKIGSKDFESNLIGYEFEDMKFLRNSGTLTHPTGNIAYASTLKKIDGQTYYFYSTGRLAAISDRFGNIIKFTYTLNGSSLTQMKIEDTLGRVVLYGNVNGKFGLFVEENGVTKTICIYEKNSRTLNAVVDAIGNRTEYQYETRKYSASYWGTGLNGRWTYVQPGNFNTYLLETVVHPTGAESRYVYNGADYTFLGFVSCGTTAQHRVEECEHLHGFRQFFRVTARYDTDGKSDYNTYYYDYGDVNYSGYPKYYGYTKDYSVIQGNYNDIETTFEYYGAQNHNVTTKTSRPWSRNPENPEPVVALSAFGYDGLDRLRSETHYTYSKDGNRTVSATTSYGYYGRTNIPTSITYPSGLTESKVFDDTYLQVTSRTVSGSGVAYFTEKYTLTADKKSAARMEVYEGSSTTSTNLKEATDFTYNSKGSVLSKRIYLGPNFTNTAQSSLITYEYGDSGFGTRFEGVYPTSITYGGVRNVDGNPIASPHGNGNIRYTYQYDWYGRVIEEGHPSSISAKKLTTYDSLGRATSVVNYDGTVVKQVFNDKGNTITATDANGSVIRYEYTPVGDIYRVVDVTGGNQTRYEYISHGESRQVLEANLLDENGVRLNYTYTYDRKDRPVDIIIRSGGKNGTVVGQTHYDYEDAISSALSKVTKTVYGDNASPSVITTTYLDYEGKVLVDGYYLNGTEYANHYKYDARGLQTQKLSALDRQKRGADSFTTKWEYDYAGNLIKEMNFEGDTFSHSYNALRNHVSFTDPKGNTTRYTYDEVGRRIQQETPFEIQNGKVIYSTNKYYYDTADNIIEVLTSSNLPGTAATFRRIGYEYDFVDNLKYMTLFRGNFPENYVAYEHDNKGNVTAVHAGLTSRDLSSAISSTYYSYDHIGNVLSITDALGQTETMEYSVLNLLNSRTDRNGNTAEYRYDPLGRLLEEKITEEKGRSLTTKYGYTFSGQLLYEENESYRAVYSYNELGQLTQVREPNDVIKTYSYDIGGNRTGLTLKQGLVTLQAVSYTYDDLNRLKTVSEAGSLVATYDYDKNGNRALVTFPGGIVESYSYNLANLITTLENRSKNTVLSSFDYSYYLDGNQAQKVDHNGLVTGYAYDAAGRLVQEAVSDDVTIDYTYDDNFNRSNMRVSGEENYQISYSYDANNRLLSSTKEEDGATEYTHYSYDANGNQLVKTVSILSSLSEEGPKIGLSDRGEFIELYSYDARDQLVSAFAEGGQIDYVYMPNGLRHSKTVNGHSTTHLWDGNQIIADVGADGSVMNQYIRGNGLLASKDNAGKRSYYMYNAHGDVVQLLDNGGQVIREYDYDAFGVEKEPVAEDTNPFRYAGEYFDIETGNIYLRARYYDPVLGRFTQQDSVPSLSIELPNGSSVEDPLSLNLYTYAHNNPIRYADPSGNSVILFVIGGVYITAEAVAFFSFVTVSAFVVLNDPNLQELMGRAWRGFLEDLRSMGDVLRQPFVSVEEEKNEKTDLPNQGEVDGGVEGAPPVLAGKQGRHVEGHNNEEEGETLWPKGETGVVETQEAWMKGKEIVTKRPGTIKVWDTGKVVGRNGETGVKVHGGKNGIHGYPVNPGNYTYK